MSTKENFVKALKELTGFDETGNQSDTAKKLKVEPIKVEVEAPKIAENSFQQSLSDSYSQAAREAFGNEDEVKTFIPKGMRVVGNIESSDRIEMLGVVEGDIATTGDVVITGTVIGNVGANDMLLQGCGIKGNVKTTGNVVVQSDAKVVGDIAAHNLTLDGKVKGNINVVETAELANGALVLGNIETGFISTSRGTRIKGNIITRQPDNYGEDDFDIKIEV